VRLVDVAPTVLDRLGIVVDPSWDLDGAAIPRQ
jgi:arylsulfatase A-like enzyme